MASELDFIFPTGSTLYVLLTQAANFVKASDGTLFTANATNWPNAAIVGSDSTLNGRYLFSIPSALAAGVYTANVYLRAGASAASTDARVGGPSVLHWTGTAIASQAAIQARVETALPSAAPNVSGGFFLPATYNGTCKNTSTSTRIVFNGTSGTLDTTQYIGWIAALSNGDVSRVVATSTGDGTDYVDVYPAFVHGAPNSGGVTFVLTQDIGARVNSSLRVDVGQVAGQTASATESIDFDKVNDIAAGGGSSISVEQTEVIGDS